MAFLQPTRLPAMAEAIYRQLAAARGGRLARASLAAGVVPRALGSSDTGEENAEFRDTLYELVQIGALTDEEDRIGLPEGLARDGAPGTMSTWVCEKAMEAERDADLWEKDENGALVLVCSRDLVRSLAWILSL